MIYQLVWVRYYLKEVSYPTYSSRVDVRRLWVVATWAEFCMSAYLHWTGTIDIINVDSMGIKFKDLNKIIILFIDRW